MDTHIGRPAASCSAPLQRGGHCPPRHAVCHGRPQMQLDLTAPCTHAPACGRPRSQRRLSLVPHSSVRASSAAATELLPPPQRPDTCTSHSEAPSPPQPLTTPSHDHNRHRPSHHRPHGHGKDHRHDQQGHSAQHEEDLPILDASHLHQYIDTHLDLAGRIRLEDDPDKPLTDPDVVKSLVLVVAGRPCVVVLKGCDRLDLKKVATVLSVPRRAVRLATPVETPRLCGFVPGTVPPLGHRTPLMTLVDAQVPRIATDALCGGGGSPTYNMLVPASVLIQHTHAKVCDVAIPAAAGSVADAPTRAPTTAPATPPTTDSHSNAQQPAASNDSHNKSQEAAAAAPAAVAAAAATAAGSSADVTLNSQLAQSGMVGGLTLPWAPGATHVELLAIVASRRRVAKLLQFCTLVPVSAPSSSPTGQAVYLRRLWANPNTVDTHTEPITHTGSDSAESSTQGTAGEACEVQLIMGKTLERTLGWEAAAQLMDSTRTGSVVRIKGRVQPHRAPAAAADGSAPPQAPQPSAEGSARTSRRSGVVLDVVCEALDVLYTDTHAMDQDIRTRGLSALDNPTKHSPTHSHTRQHDAATNNTAQQDTVLIRTRQEVPGNSSNTGGSGVAGPLQAPATARAVVGAVVGGRRRKAGAAVGPSVPCWPGPVTYRSEFVCDIEGLRRVRGHVRGLIQAQQALLNSLVSGPHDTATTTRTTATNNSNNQTNQQQGWNTERTTNGYANDTNGQPNNPGTMQAASAIPGAAAGAAAEVRDGAHGVASVSSSVSVCEGSWLGLLPPPVAVDCEWVPYSKGQTPTPVALLQIATRGHVYLIDLLAIAAKATYRKRRSGQNSRLVRIQAPTTAVPVPTVGEALGSALPPPPPPPDAACVELGELLADILLRPGPSTATSTLSSAGTLTVSLTEPSTATQAVIGTHGASSADSDTQRAEPGKDASEAARMRAAAARRVLAGGTVTAGAAGPRYVDLLHLARSARPEVFLAPGRDRPHVYSLSRLVRTVLGAPLDKGCQVSDWSARPLRPDQRQYAEIDVLSLVEMHDVLLGTQTGSTHN